MKSMSKATVSLPLESGRLRGPPVFGGVFLSQSRKPSGRHTRPARLPGRQQLLLFLGPVPTRLPASPPLEQASWRLRLRPAAMAQAGLLSPELPPVVRRAQQLNLSGHAAGQRSGERQSSLSGWLDLR